jgi:hypothetical protein
MHRQQLLQMQQRHPQLRLKALRQQKLRPQLTNRSRIERGIEFDPAIILRKAPLQGAFCFSGRRKSISEDEVRGGDQT